MYNNHNIEDFRAPFTEETLAGPDDQGGVMSTTQMTGLSECLTAAQGMIDAILQMPPKRIIFLPLPFCE